MTGREADQSDELCKGFDPEGVARLLADRKHLERDNDGKHLAILRSLLLNLFPTRPSSTAPCTGECCELFTVWVSF